MSATEEVQSSALEGPVELESTCPWSLETSSQRPLLEAQVHVLAIKTNAVVVIPRRGTRDRTDIGTIFPKDTQSDMKQLDCCQLIYNVMNDFELNLVWSGLIIYLIVQ